MEQEIKGTCPIHGEVAHTQPCAVLLRPSRCIPCVNEAQVAAFTRVTVPTAVDEIPVEIKV